MERFRKVHSCPELMALIDEVGILPLLPLGISGWSADEAVDEDCGYTVLPDGGWEWPLWEWKGDIIRETGCAYGKFIDQKAAFVSKRWWPDFCNYRRSRFPRPDESSVEGMVLATLSEGGSMITRDLRRACGFTGPKMRGKFDSLVSRLQMGGYIVTEDFVYPTDRHGKRYGWGWSLLTTPEALFGREACTPNRAPKESHKRLVSQLHKVLPDCNEAVFNRLLR